MALEMVDYKVHARLVNVTFTLTEAAIRADFFEYYQCLTVTAPYIPERKSVVSFYSL